MDALGLRDSQDIDVIVSQELFEELRRRGRKRSIEHDEEVLKYSDAEAWTTFPHDGKALTLESLLHDSVQIEEVMFVSPEFLLRWKQGKRRPKDIQDIQLLEEHLTHAR